MNVLAVEYARHGKTHIKMTENIIHIGQPHGERASFASERSSQPASMCCFFVACATLAQYLDSTLHSSSCEGVAIASQSMMALLVSQ